ncbi:MAG: P-loop NTPase [Candidatus Aminicenantes bacterium]|nr:P-loop NTPase [Candidatus Aminicenantes bacterium]
MKPKQLVMISGKGGTGKTILSACFAHLAENKIMVDCDVDAANLHILLDAQVKETHLFSGGKEARLIPEKCTGCLECVDICRFDAIHENREGKIFIDPLSCEGCAVCSHICPLDAIAMDPAESGEWFVSETKYGPFVHAKLGAGEENSGKLITEIRKKSTVLAEQNKSDLVIVDGPPGIGCPVIASLTGADLALVVTEPTPSGIHDMKRVIQTAQHFHTDVACIINKYDLNQKNTSELETWCQKEHISLAGKIPFDLKIFNSMVQGIPHTETSSSPASKEIQRIWQSVFKQLKQEETNG